MSVETPTRHSGASAARLVLVVNDVEEIREGIVALLAARGYRVSSSRSEDEAVRDVVREVPALILVSLPLRSFDVMAGGIRIRERAGLDAGVPIVIFTVPSLDEGEEMHVGFNVHLTRPDNFDQLSATISRLLSPSP